MLEDMELHNCLIVGGDFNTINHSRVEHRQHENLNREWERTKKLKNYFRIKHRNKNEVTYIPETVANRKVYTKGRRLDIIKISEDLLTCNIMIINKDKLGLSSAKLGLSSAKPRTQLASTA